MNKQALQNLFFMLITDRNLCKHSFFDTIRLALEGGVKTVQLREKGLSTKELYFLAYKARKITFDFHANLIVNDRVDVALAVDADGVHLGWQSLPPDIVRRIIGHEKLMGISTHNRQEALQAQLHGADYITFGPVFDTPSKSGILEPTGPAEIQKLKKELNLPVIALGGIHRKNVDSVLKARADGIAVISSIMYADAPEEAARRLYEKIVKYGAKSKMADL
ncbi:MAG TPA: thiamine phosphate synthase [Candidatus Brocadiaceae bacterium]